MAEPERAFVNARLIDPAQELDGIGSLLVRDGKIVAIGTDIEIPDTAETLDCTGLAMPGLMTCRCLPASRVKNTARHAQHHIPPPPAVTHMVVMPNTHRRLTMPRLSISSADAHAAPPPCASTRWRPSPKTARPNHDRVRPIARSQRGGICRWGSRGMNALTMRRALSYASNFDALIVQHALDQDLQSAGVMHEGELATRLGLTGIPVAAESAIIDRDIGLVELTGARYHIHQISSAKALKPCVRQKRAVWR